MPLHHAECGQYQSPFLTDVSPVLVNDGEAICIWILSEADGGGRVFSNGGGQLGQIGLGGLRHVRKNADGFAVKVDEITTECFEESSPGRATGGGH